MNTPVIIDSSALFALVSQDDSNHEQAVEVSGRLSETQRAVVLLSEVFAETLNIVGKKLGRPQQLALAREVLDSRDFIFSDETPQMRENAVTKLSQQPGSVSYTDALVMAFADLYNSRLIFGFDDVFRKNGYLLPTNG